MPGKEKILNKISVTANRNKFEIYLVGGYVRDKLLGIDNNDIDISVIGDAIEFASLCAKEFETEPSAVYKKFGTALLMIPLDENTDLKIEFASARTESYS